MSLTNENQKYFLALQKRPGDFKFIDISKLNISLGFTPTSLAEIDAFTINYSIEDILKSIKIANIVEEEYQKGTLVIQDNQKHNPLKVIDRTYLDDFSIDRFFIENINDKEMMNRIVCKLSSILKEERKIPENLKKAIRYKNIDAILAIIFSISYPLERKLMLYLIDIYHEKKEKTKCLTREKATE